MKNGLKGVTDATVFCKSMQKGGAKPMIRSMKSYAEGGMAETSRPGPFGRKVKRVMRKVKNAFKNMGDSGPTYRKSKCGGPGCWN